MVASQKKKGLKSSKSYAAKKKSKESQNKTGAKTGAKSDADKDIGRDIGRTPKLDRGWWCTWRCSRGCCCAGWMIDVGKRDGLVWGCLRVCYLMSGLRVLTMLLVLAGVLVLVWRLWMGGLSVI